MNWLIEKIISKGDYNYALVRNHPNATKNGYVLHHRIVVENKLNRLLTSDEIVHHINENKKDNDENNLEVMSASDHQKLHGTTGRTVVELKCPNCGTTFFREKRQTYLSKKGKFTCCSNSCRGSFSRQIQLHGYTEKILEKMNSNLISTKIDKSW